MALIIIEITFSFTCSRIPGGVRLQYIFAWSSKGSGGEDVLRSYSDGPPSRKHLDSCRENDTGIASRAQQAYHGRDSTWQAQTRILSSGGGIFTTVISTSRGRATFRMSRFEQ